MSGSIVHMVQLSNLAYELIRAIRRREEGQGSEMHGVVFSMNCCEHIAMRG